MPLNFQQVRQHLDQFEFGTLFVDELGWSRPSGKTAVRLEVAGATFEAQVVAQLGGVPVLEVRSPDGGIPDADQQRAIHRELAKLHYENLLIFVDNERARSDWYWVRRENGRETPRSHEYLRGQPGDLFFGKIAPLLFEISDFDENGDVEVVKVAQRLKLGLDVEKVTKKFYTDFQQQHLQFLKLITGIDDERELRWYASVLLNRLMFIWFLQRKGFIDRGDLDYLDRKLAESKKHGRDRFFRDFLKLLFFEGFAKPAEERSVEARQRLGEIRYLNGGLFLPHAIEQNHPDLDVPDMAFDNLFDLFRRYSWNLNDTPGGDANEINPDVLGYIFEKYINQKAFGAYYTRTEITSYLCERTIERLVLDAVNTSKDERLRAMPGKNYDFKSLGDLLLNLDSTLCRRLFKNVLPKLSILDPACGSGAFLVAAMKTLIKIYGGVIGQVRFVGDNDLRREIAEIEKTHPNIDYFVKKSIITDNLYGVDIMEEAVEIARLRLFLALVASARSIDHLEPLPNIDFNLLPGNSLIGLMRVDEKKFETGDLFRKSYRQVVDEKNREVATYRHTASYHDDLRGQRDKIDRLRADAAKSLDKILLEEFGALGIKYEEATWDHAKQREGKGKKRALTIADIRELQPFHWGYEFDEIVNRRGGFDAILTNPPWESVVGSAKEFFSHHGSDASKNSTGIKDFERELDILLKNEDVKKAWLSFLSSYNYRREYFKHAEVYRHQRSVVGGRERTDINLYKLFVERCFQLLRDTGECGIVLPGSIYADIGAKGLREMLFSSSEITGVFGFENRKQVFEGVDSRFKFVVLTYRKGGSTTEMPVAFMRHDVEELSRFPAEGALTLKVETIRRLSPESASFPEFRSEADLKIADKLTRFPLLGEDVEGLWRPTFRRELHMTDDAYLFETAPGKDRLPLYEGRMFHQFDAFYSVPRYFVDQKKGREALGAKQQSDSLNYERCRLAYRDVAANTNERTMIAAILPPRVFAGHTVYLCANTYPMELLYLCAILNSFVFDWLMRLKVSAHCNPSYVYQSPVPRLAEGNGFFDQLAMRAARLTCTRSEFDDLAREAGIAPGDAAHEPADRARVRAEIDAIVANLYGITAEEFEHILAAFPLVDAATKAQVLDTFRTWKPPSDDPLLKLIAAGESSRLEFKATARWNIRENKADKAMEQTALKTVAAFMNSDGGTLLIGVTDEGTIRGLRDDFKTLGSKQNADAFENWLTTRLLETMGRDLARLLTTTFATIEGKQICRVDVRRSPRPVFLPDAQNVEQLYVRAGNSTRMLSVSEALQYCREHFANVPELLGEQTKAMPLAATSPSQQSELMKPGTIETKATSNLVTHGLFKKKNEADDQAEQRRRLVDQYEIDDVVAIVRDVVSGGEPMNREEAIRQIGRELGAERVGSRIRDLIESGLNAASRRSIIYTDHRGLRALCRTIEDYKRDDLKNVLRSVVGRTWKDEDEAIRLGARYLGFRRTGSRIEQAFRSAIRGGLRQNTFERNGNLIRAT